MPAPQLYNLAAERAVLGACLLGNLDVITRIRGQLPVDAFYTPRHAALWRIICALADDGTPPDHVTVPARAKQAGERWSEPDDTVWLFELYEQAPLVASPAHAAEVASWARIRRIHETGTRLAHAAASTADVGADFDSALDRLLATAHSELAALSDPDGLAQRQADRAVAEQAERIRIRQRAEAAVHNAALPPIPPMLRLDELLSRPVPEQRWRVNNIWPRRGRVVLAAAAKTGKTTFRDNLARCLIDGGFFLDKYRVEPVDGTVAILDFELAEDNLQQWLRDQGIQDESRLWVHPLRGHATAFELFDDQRRAEWATLLRERNVDVLIIDCLGPILGAFGLDESKGVDVGRWLNSFESLLDQAQIAEALIIHHMGHMGERSRGASRLRDWPDAEWKLVRAAEGGEDAPDPTRYFSAIGRDVEEPEARLRYDPMDRHLRLEEGNRAQAHLRRDLPTLIEWLKEHPDSSSTEIETGLYEAGIGRNRSRKALKAGIRQGDICVHKPGGRRTNHRAKAQCAECASIRHPEVADAQE